MKNVSVLSFLEPGEYDLLTALPVRVGWFVGKTERRGGAVAERLEEEALLASIVRISGNAFLSPLVQELFEQALARQSDWRGLGDDLSNVPDECARVRGLLNGRVSVEDIEALNRSLIDVATSVALAYREFGMREALIVRIRAYMLASIRQASLAIPGMRPAPLPSGFAALSVSRYEQGLIADLARALNPTPPAASDAV